MLISIKRGLEVIIWSWSISRVFRPRKKGGRKGAERGIYYDVMRYLGISIKQINPNKKAPTIAYAIIGNLLKKWRRDRDLNPGYGITAHMISNHAPSAARTPLHVFCCVTGTCIVYEKVRFMSRLKW